MENRQWRLKRYPEGLPTPADWNLVRSEASEPRTGEVLARALFWDVAPYMRGRIAPQANYAAGVAPGDVMIGGAIAEVVDSKAEGWQAGDRFVTDFHFGWQDYATLAPAGLRRIGAGETEIERHLDVLGLNGITAWFALFETGAMRPGDTVVVSAAAGSVGQITGQLVKAAGGRAVAVASTSAKLARCREIGYADGIAYREENDLAAALARVCPAGIDVFIDNSAGPIHDAVMQNLATRARIVVVGTVSLADRFGQTDIGPRFLRQILVARARIEGFLCLDFAARYEEARSRLKALLDSGELTTRFDIVDGFEQLPAGLCGLFEGDNIGKRLIRRID